MNYKYIIYIYMNKYLYIFIIFIIFLCICLLSKGCINLYENFNVGSPNLKISDRCPNYLFIYNSNISLMVDNRLMPLRIS